MIFMGQRPRCIGVRLWQAYPFGDVHSSRTNDSRLRCLLQMPDVARGGVSRAGPSLYASDGWQEGEGQRQQNGSNGKAKLAAVRQSR